MRREALEVKVSDTMKALAAPFTGSDLEWKVQSCGVKQDGEIWALIIPYISARACAQRLDEVFGIDGWQVEYRPIDLGKRLARSKQDPKSVIEKPVTGVVATLRVRVRDGEWVTREDASEPTDVEPLKGGISGAFKRVCAVLGIGRYLYSAKPVWATINERGAHRCYDAKTKTSFRWDVPPVALAELEGRHSGNGAPPAPPPKPKPGEPVEAVPPCPSCGGKMRDQRRSKTKATQPDYVCTAINCKGVIWPPKGGN